jgi:hypothetical protein
MSPGPEGVFSGGIDPYFCRDLIVPDGCECILKVPVRCLSKGPFEVRDLNEGSEVLKVEPRALHQRGRGAKGHFKLVLTTEFGVIVAQCMPSADQSWQSKQRECVLVRASGDIFAVVAIGEGMEEQDRDRYTLTTKLNGRLYMWRCKHEQTLSFVDSTGKLVALADFSPSGAKTGQQPQASQDPNEVYFKLRVAPLMDVGLILCGLLCIHHFM